MYDSRGYKTPESETREFITQDAAACMDFQVLIIPSVLKTHEEGNME